MIVIVDYEMGNFASIQNMIKKVGSNAEISSDPVLISQATKLILPGVGSFYKGMHYLRKKGLIDLLHELVLNKKIPILGICLGLQLMSEFSEEGNVNGLGWIKAKTIRFPLNHPLKIPHIGWTDIEVCKDSKLLNKNKNYRFYFVHSYHLICDDDKYVLCSAEYGYKFVAGIEKDNILGVQFHPEKSHKFGMELMNHFITNY